jgi:uncharacterized membrane protein
LNSRADQGGPPLHTGSTGSGAFNINDAGQVVGLSIVAGVDVPTEWSGGSIINLGGLPGSTGSIAQSINDTGQVVGVSAGATPPPVPEPSTWAMMLVGFAGLAFTGYRRRQAA